MPRITQVVVRAANGHVPFRSELHRAFTMVEMVVVITIVTLLITMLLPTLAQARKATHDMICKADLRQIAVGLQTYVQENSGYFPTIYNNNTSGIPDMIMQTLSLAPYDHTTQATYANGTYSGTCPIMLAPARDVMQRHLKLVDPPIVRMSELGYDTALIGAVFVAKYGLESGR